METVITIDTDILSKAMQNAAGQTQRQLVEDALRLFSLQNGQSEVRKYRERSQGAWRIKDWKCYRFLFVRHIRLFLFRFLYIPLP